MDVSFFDRAAAVLPDACFELPPDVGMVLGSGWGDAMVTDRPIVQVDYSDIPGLGAASVPGHPGEFRLFEYNGRRVAEFRGRRHRYEGASWEQVTAPVELLRRMGCGRILLTNASGAINPALHAGDFVVIRDHVNTIGANPLEGPHNPEWGVRFPDMTEVYCRRYRELLRGCANRHGFRAMEGVYAYTSGPLYETPAEVRAYGHWGVDIVGMSTVPEAVFAHACGMAVAGVSLVSNLAAGISPEPLSHEEVIQAAEAARPMMRLLMEEFISQA